MDKWEYQFLQVRVSDNEDLDKVEQEINPLGSAGWEAVSMVFTYAEGQIRSDRRQQGVTTYRILLKRRKK
jgi:hypothetical protein